MLATIEPRLRNPILDQVIIQARLPGAIKPFFQSKFTLCPEHT